MKTNVNLWWGTSWFSCVTITMKKLFTLFLVVGLALSAQNAFADHPGGPSDNGVQPIYVDGNPTCADLMGDDIEGLLEYRINEVGSGTFPTGDGTSVYIDVRPDKTFDWVASGMIVHSIFVKGGPAGNLYEYSELTNSDGGLHSPVNHKNGNYYGLSHISFCYVPGAPDIEITKTCTESQVLSDGEGGLLYEYDYRLEVTNTGTLTLYDIKATDITAENNSGNMGDHEHSIAMLDPSDPPVIINGTFTTAVNGPENHAKVEAATEQDGTPVVNDTASFQCPDQLVEAELTITKNCNVVVVNNNGAYGLKVNFGGEVCNESIVDIANVVVEDYTDADNPVFIENLGTLGAGACVPYNGSYVPTPGDGFEATDGFSLDGFYDVVKVTGEDADGVVVLPDSDDATCTLCPQCVDMEMCPTPASAIDLE
ncbi:hypothetical protein [Pseudoalteromonas sp. T1lg10]|uniref:hypothetical protein n=1 Tax=Pseudoalteromonas sp. T1lg10 TaxID=2077093 RepID=UPI000CF708A4|nr:hypothetical protein [Pseudoalteromonas sp. T1lg10]